MTNVLIPQLDKAFDAYGERIRGLNEKVFVEVGGFPEPGEDLRIFLKRAAIALIIGDYADRPELKAVGEKTPGNIRDLDLLRQLFPGARFVFMLRDGRDIAVSGWLHLKRQWGEQAGEETLANYARRLAKIWRMDIERAQRFAALHPAACHWVRYEDLHADVSGTLVGILDFLGLDNSPETVRKCVDAGNFKRLSQGRDRGEENTDSHFRKGIVGDWRNHFDNETARIFDEEAGAVLDELGYTD